MSCANVGEPAGRQVQHSVKGGDKDVSGGRDFQNPPVDGQGDFRRIKRAPALDHEQRSDHGHEESRLHALVGHVRQ